MQLLHWIFLKTFPLTINWIWEWSGFFICHPLIIKFIVAYWVEFMFFSSILLVPSSKIRGREKKIDKQAKEKVDFFSLSYGFWPVCFGYENSQQPSLLKYNPNPKFVKFLLTWSGIHHYCKLFHPCQLKAKKVLH